jgi:hypothetical protein
VMQVRDAHWLTPENRTDLNWLETEIFSPSRQYIRPHLNLGGSFSLDLT